MVVVAVVVIVSSYSIMIKIIVIVIVIVILFAIVMMMMMDLLYSDTQYRFTPLLSYCFLCVFIRVWKAGGLLGRG